MACLLPSHVEGQLLQIADFPTLCEDLPQTVFFVIRFGKEGADTAGHISIKRCEDVALNF